MLNSNKLIEKMKLHFPKWMDIRKRIKTSNGGKYLTATANEISYIQKTIDEYKNSFFIQSYKGKENEITSFLYRTQIGDIDINYFSLTEPRLYYTNDINDFYNNDKFFYIENGFLYLKPNTINQYNEITYKINNVVAKSIVEKYHVWNVFDEFACFFGEKRYENETNLELENRILNKFKYNINSSNDGLKNAIKNALINIDKDLDIDKIKVERSTPENLLKYYNKFETVLDKLNSINKDIYKYKKWNIDNWNYEINSIDYIPHAFDIIIDNYIDGVGYEDDLKVVIADSNNKTNLTVGLYKEDLDQFSMFIKNQDVEHNIDLKLSKYKNYFTPSTAKYKIIATDAVDISNESIKLLCKKIKYINKYYNLDSLLVPNNDLDIIKNNEFNISENFKIKIESNNLEPLYITKLDVNNETLLKEKDGFRYNGINILENYRNNIYINSINDLNEYYNLLNSEHGIVVDNLAQQAHCNFSINSYQNQPFYIDYDCDTFPLLQTKLDIKNFTYINDKYKSNLTYEEKYINIEDKYNRVKFSIDGDNYLIVYNLNDEIINTYKGNGKFIFDTNNIKKFLSPVNMKIKIIPIANNLNVCDIEYSKFNIEFKLKYGDFINNNNNNKILLPDFEQNDLSININAYTNKPPYIKSIFIGENKTQTYKTDIIRTIKNNIIDINTNGIVSIINNNEEIILNNIITTNSFKAIKDTNILLDLNNFNNIYNISSQVGIVKKIDNKYYISLKKDNIISNVFIKGEINTTLKEISINEIFNINTSLGDKIYINKHNADFIIKKSNIEEVKQLSFKDYSFAEEFEIINLPKNIICSYIINNKNIFTNNITHSFDKIHLIPTDTNIHIAYNEKTLIDNYIDNVDIVDVFNPLLPATNNNMIYYLESLTDKLNVSFDTNNNFSIGRKSIKLSMNKDMYNIDNYNYNVFNFDLKDKLNTQIKIPQLFHINNEIHSPNEFIIEAEEGYEVFYKTRDKSLLPDEGIIKESQYYVHEKVLCTNNFRKLKYSNIDEIFYIKTDNNKLIESLYTIYDKEGLIVFKNDHLNNSYIDVFYSIKIPDSIFIDKNILYKKINYDLKAYKLLRTLKYYNLYADDEINLNYVPEMKVTSKLIINCSSPGFKGELHKNILKIQCILKEKELAIKTGYYYLNNKEYFLFNNKNEEDKTEIKNNIIKLINVEEGDNELSLNKESTNLIKNSYMELGELNETLKIDFSNKFLDKISNFNLLTACDNYNYWTSVGIDMSLVNGLNGQGIKFIQKYKNSYAYIDITKACTDTTYISLYCNKINKISDKIYDEIYLGYKNLNIIENDIIKIKKKLSLAYDKNILECTFNKENNTKYYLIVKCDCILDDIIITNNKDNTNNHKKNIDIINLKCNEKILDNYTRIFNIDNYGSKFINTQMDKNNTISNLSTITWNNTELYNLYNSDFKKCYLEKAHIDDIIVLNKNGVLITEPIYIKNKDNINKLYFKINNITYNENFKVIILGADNEYDNYTELYSSNKNNFNIKNHMNYIKIKILSYTDFIIDNLYVYADYFSNESIELKTVVKAGGIFKSKIFDAQSNNNYKLKAINIKNISNINNVEIKIRASRDEEQNTVWHDFIPIKLDDNCKIINNIEFFNVRFFQIKICLLQANAYILLDNIELEVI